MDITTTETTSPIEATCLPFNLGLRWFRLDALEFKIAPSLAARPLQVPGR